MSDPVLIAAIGASTTILGGLITLLGRWLGKTLQQVHTLVNSNMGAQLRLVATTSRRLAALTGQQVDIEAAELAERLLRDHDAKQDVVDRSQAVPGTDL